MPAALPTTKRASTYAIVAYAVVLILVGPNGATTSLAAQPLRVTHGIATGDVTATSAVIWARASGSASMVVEYTSATPLAWPPLRQSGPVVDASSDFTGKVVLDGLTQRPHSWPRRYTLRRTASLTSVGQRAGSPPVGAVASAPGAAGVRVWKVTSR